MKQTILLVGETPEESWIQEYLPEWRIETASLAERASLNVESTLIVTPLPEDPDIVLLYAQNNPEDTIAVCKQLRNAPETSKSAILLAVGRYQINQGSDVKKLGNAAMIIRPYSGEVLSMKIAHLLESGSPYKPGA